MLDESFMSLHTGDIVKGTVINVTNNEVTVNLGYKSDGIINRSEFTDDPQADLRELVKPGDVFRVCVIRVNDGDGNVMVSKRKVDNQRNYELLEQAFNEKTTMRGKVSDIVKGGLIAIIQGARVFVPSSQISNRFVEDLNTFKGKEFDFHILEFERSSRGFRRVVAGRKELAAQEAKQRRDELFAQLEIGQHIDGTVSRIVDFGAFVDLGGVDGLIHISELAWKRVRKVSDVLQAGDNVTVTVIGVDSEKNKISLSLKDSRDNPWHDIVGRYPIDSIVEGTVVRLAPFGAFVNLEDGVDGLVHISQIANKHVAKPEDVLTVGQAIQVKITEIDQVSHKISLSKREADVELGIAEPDEVDEMDETVPPESNNEAEPSAIETTEEIESE
jgi:4-hydroxy-3-methylbut-2-enyl diphosphate reductase